MSTPANVACAPNHILTTYRSPEHVLSVAFNGGCATIDVRLAVSWFPAPTSIVDFLTKASTIISCPPARISIYKKLFLFYIVQQARLDA